MNHLEFFLIQQKSNISFEQYNIRYTLYWLNLILRVFIIGARRFKDYS